MNTTMYRVTCKNCNKFETVPIDNENNIHWPIVKYIISGRYRLDMNWGWQCLCGNNDLETTQERKEIKNLSAPDPSDITRVLKSIIPDKPKFSMEAI